jgi:single-stranded DNA-binding protein
MTNPNNYEGATVTVVGKAGGAPEEVFDGKTTRFSVAVNQGYKKDGEWVDTGTVWYTVQGATDYAEQHWPDIEAGDKVRVDDAKLEVRLFSKNDGSPGVELRLSYAGIKVIERKSEREKVSSNKPF